MLIKEKVWFDNKINPLTLTKAEEELLVKFTRSALGINKETITLNESLLTDREPRIILLSFGDNKTSAKVVIGEGIGITEAIENAIKAIQKSFLSQFKTPSLFKLDLVIEVKCLEYFNLKNPLPLPKTLYGLAFDKDKKIALTAEELVTHNLVNRKGIISKKNLVKYLKKRIVSTSLTEKLQINESQTLYQFKTTSLFSDGKSIVTLYRGHRIFEENISQESLKEAAILAGQYLTNSVDSYGKFIYSYLPKTDAIVNEYNILRHAGTIYSMLEIYEVQQDFLLLEAAKRAINYLINAFMHPYPNDILPGGNSNDDRTSLTCLVESGYLKLGGNALAILALVKYTQVCQDSKYLPIIKSLARWIKAIQKPDGSFQFHKQSYPDGEVSSFNCRFYLGQVIFALARLYQLNRDRTWLDTAEATANYVINVRDGKLSPSQLPPDHWLLYGLNELYRCRPHKIYKERSQQIANTIIENQNLTSIYPDKRGTFNTPPTSNTSTATRSEGLLAAYQLIRDYGDRQLARRILKACRIAVAFQLQSQFRAESAMYLPHPQRVIGGFRRSLTNFEIRIDYVQHNISSILSLYNIESSIEAEDLLDWLFLAS